MLSDGAVFVLNQILKSAVSFFTYINIVGGEETRISSRPSALLKTEAIKLLQI